MDDTVRMIQELTDAALGRSDRPIVVPKSERIGVQTELGVIDQHSHVDTMPVPAGSMPGLKRAVLRLGAFNWMRQRAINVSVGKVLSAVLAELDELRATVIQNDRRASASAVATETAIDEIRRSATLARDHQAALQRLEEAGRDLQASIDSVLAASAGSDAQLAQHASDIADLRADLMAAESRLVAEQRHTAALRGEIARMRIDGPVGSLADDPDPIQHDVAEMYARFEVAFRPSNDELDRRFEDYLDVLDHLRDSTHTLLDLGAGRGEFVAMLTAHRIPSQGVDLSADAVEEAQRNGRPVHRAEAVQFLASLDSESIGAVTAFHVIEHLEPETVLRVLDESLRVLRPGGLLILETPNPTNLNVGAAAFYQDPTHLRPVTPTYLEFLVRDRGFTDVETRFLHPLPEYALPPIKLEGAGARASELLLDDLRWALKGPQDYAVLARRPAQS